MVIYSSQTKSHQPRTALLNEASFMSEKKVFSSSTETDSPNSIESALARLETIVTDIESEPPPLEILMERYEEGVQLLKICQEKLMVAEERIEMITRNARGEATLQPLSE